MAQPDLLLELARFVERIVAIARTGLAFKPDGFDSERYEELLAEAARMHAALAATDAQAAETTRRRWRESVVSGYEGYVTAAVGVGAIVFNSRDEVLMMKRPSGRWWYPTGFCDVGVSPAENVAKEVREELGLIVRPTRLIGVVDSLKVGSPGAAHLRDVVRLRYRERRAHSQSARSPGGGVLPVGRTARSRCMGSIESGSAWHASSTSTAAATPSSIRCEMRPDVPGTAEDGRDFGESVLA